MCSWYNWRKEMTAHDIVEVYTTFFAERGHKRIKNVPLIPQDDPTTLFTSSGMQALLPYLLGEPHPEGKRLVNVQNCFRAQDIDEVGDNRHTTFFRMLGNWSLGDYFKKEQLPWFFEFLTQKLHLKAEKLFVSVFQGFNDIPKDEESAKIWEELFASVGVDPRGRIFYYGTSKNWWSRAGEPQDMPTGEPGGPDSEVFFDLETPHDPKFGKVCHPNCNCARFLEIGNAVFMEYVKKENGSFAKLPQRNVDFGGGLERLLAAVEEKQDVFQTSLFAPIVKAVEQATNIRYEEHARQMRIVADHTIAACFIAQSGVVPSNKEQGYVLRRLIRRALDSLNEIGGKDISSVVESVVQQYRETDPTLVEQFEGIKYTIVEEEVRYQKTKDSAVAFIIKKYPVGDELKGVSEISAEDAFVIYTTHGLSPTQIRSLGFTFDEQGFAHLMGQHQRVSRRSLQKRFRV